MDEKRERDNDDQITFTLGKGNQSAICGGVAPMAVDGLQKKTDAYPANPTDMEKAAGSGNDFQPTAEAKV